MWRTTMTTTMNNDDDNDNRVGKRDLTPPHMHAQANFRPLLKAAAVVVTLAVLKFPRAQQKSSLRTVTIEPH